MTKKEKKQAREEYKRKEYKKMILQAKHNQHYPENLPDVVDEIHRMEQEHNLKILVSRDVIAFLVTIFVEGVRENQNAYVSFKIHYGEQDILPFVRDAVRHFEHVYGASQK